MRLKAYKFFVVLIFSSFLKPVIFCQKDVFGGQNIFLNRTEELLTCVQKMQDNIDKDKSGQTDVFSSDSGKTSNLLLKEMRFFLDRLCFYRFTNNNMSGLELDKIFNQIDGRHYRFLNSGQSLLNKESFDELSGAFDLMRNGISYGLCFDHLMIFRKALLNHLKELIILNDYWIEEFNNLSLFEKIQKGFGKTLDKNDIEDKIKKLGKFKERTASFIGKTDEVLYQFFREIKSGKNSEKLCGNVSVLVRDGIFCLHSFFSKTFDPDSSKYGEQLKNFNSLAMQEVSGVLCKNHANIRLIKTGLKLQLKKYQIPSFARRHWFLLSTSTVALVTGGVLLYQNWDVSKNWTVEAFGLAKTKTQAGYNGLTNKFKEIKKRLWPEMEAVPEREVAHQTLRDIVGRELDKMDESSQAFKATFSLSDSVLKEMGKFENLELPKVTSARAFKDKITEKITDPEQRNRLLQFFNGVRDEKRVVPEDYCKQFKFLFPGINLETFFPNGDGLETMSPELYQNSMRRILDGLEKFTNETLKLRQVNFAGVSIDLGKEVENFNTVFTQFMQACGLTVPEAVAGQEVVANPKEVRNLIEKLKENLEKLKEKLGIVTVGKAKHFVDDFLENLEKVKEDELDTKTLESLKQIIVKFISMINLLPEQIGNIGIMTKFYQVVFNKVLTDTLHLTHGIFDKIVDEADKYTGDLRNLKNATLSAKFWVQSLITVITAITVPTVIILLVKRHIKIVEKEKLESINSIISKVYRILNYYNSSAFDYYNQELRYCDQGLISYWIEELNGKTSNIDKIGKEKLSRLIGDLRNPDLSVNQKIDFIKLEWGKNLFGASVLA